MGTFDQLRQEANNLPVADRAALAADLLETLRTDPATQRGASRRPERTKWFRAAAFAGLVAAGVGLVAILKG